MENTLFDKIKMVVLALIMVGIPYFKFIHFTYPTVEFAHCVYILWYAIPVLLILYIIGLFKKESSFNYLDIIMIVLVILAMISTNQAISIRVSFFGEINRNEGLLSLASYYLIFLNAKTIKNEEIKKLLVNLFLYLGLFQLLYAFLQVYTNLELVKRAKYAYMATGLCGNPNFFSSYMAMLVILTSTMYIKNKELKYLILAIVYNIGLVLAETSGPFLAVIITLVFIMIYFRKNEYVKRTLLISLILFASFLITNTAHIYIQEKIFNREIETEYNIGRELVDISDTLVNSSDSKKLKRVGNGRLVIWSKLLPKVKDYWLFGAGLDNIAYIYPQSKYIIYDKAHNVYLQILLTNGLPALVLYCALCLIIFIKGFKLKNDDISLYMLFVVYSIQAFVNISVVEVAPYFFLFFGLLSSNFDKNLLMYKSKRNKIETAN